MEWTVHRKLLGCDSYLLESIHELAKIIKKEQNLSSETNFTYPSISLFLFGQGKVCSFQK
jgi:hypothetical protein